MNAPFTNFRRKQRTKSIPPKPDRFVAYIDSAFVEQILYVPERPWKTDVQHHGKSNDLWRRFEVPKWIGLGHHQTLIDRPARLKPFTPDSTAQSA